MDVIKLLKQNRMVWMVLLALIVTGACNFFSAVSPPATQPPEVIYTAAAQTVQAQITQIVQETSAPQSTLPFPTSTPLSLPTTALPTSTPFPTRTPLPTPTPLPCHWVQFVADVSAVDGSLLASGASFIKTWRLKNIGSCTWTTDYDLFFINGDSMGAQTLVEIPKNTAPGETVDVSVTLTAPEEPGEYLGNWQLRSPNGFTFGIGANQNQSFWVNIEVVEQKFDHIYDFAVQMCKATWRSGSRIPCPKGAAESQGFVQLLDAPHFENDYVDNELTLWLHPQEEGDDWLVGTFPAFAIQDGDHFVSHIGCLYGYEDCDVRFKLNYIDEDDEIHNLGTWDEVYDDAINKLDIDLSHLADQEIRFSLMVKALDSPEDAHVFWLAPHIQR